MHRLIKNPFTYRFKLPTPLAQTYIYHSIPHYTFSSFKIKNQSTFQSQLGLRNKQTFMGRVKRFQKRKPKLAQFIKFHLIFLLFSVMVLSLVPGSSLPFQKRFKLSVFHMKAWFNYYWNYTIGNEKEKYIYLLLEDLMAQMNYHQIYDVKQFQRVFQQVDRVLEEDFQRLKGYLEREVNKVKEKREFMTVKTQQLKDTVSVASMILGDHVDASNKHKKNQESYNAKSKRSQLKNKLKTQMDTKYKVQKEKQTTKEQINAKKIKQTAKQQPNPQLNPQVTSSSTNNIIQSPKSIQTTINTPKQSPQQDPSINLKKLLSSSLCNSPSFSYNMLMYYVLILENVLRYDTQLIKEEGFYEVYRQGVDNFVFSDRIQILLKGVIAKNDNNQNTNGSGNVNNKRQVSSQGYKELNDQIWKQIEFVKLLRGSVLSGGSVSSGQTKTKHQNTSQAIDPHKLITYLINYRHLINNRSNKINNRSNKIKRNKTMENDQDQSDKQQKEYNGYDKLNKNEETSNINCTKDILINYYKLIQGEQSKNRKDQLFGRVITRLQRQDKMIQLAVNNKPFINSLKQLYLDQKLNYDKVIGEEQKEMEKHQTKKNGKMDEQKQKQDNNKSKSRYEIKQNIQSQMRRKKEEEKQVIDCKSKIDELKILPTHKLVECIFLKIDKWYNRQQGNSTITSTKS